MSLRERVSMPSFAGGAEWLNSELLGPGKLPGRVVLVNFWTCINWQEPHVRAWPWSYRESC